MKIIYKLFLLTIFILPLTLHAQVLSSFNTDSEGWGVYEYNGVQTAPLPVWNSTGGNPGGFISLSISGSLPTPYYFSGAWYFEAPAKFLGNQSKAINQTLDFNLMQSMAGGDLGSAEIIIGTAGLNIVAPVTAVPATGSWSSYSVLLSTAAGWKVNSLAGTVATKEDIKTVLSNVSFLRIRAKYAVGAFAGVYVASLDNVVLNIESAPPPPPVITSFAPLSGLPASTSITITGTNFGATIAQNVVYFGTIKSTITSATATRLDVTVPYGAQLDKITALNLTNGLSARSAKNFVPQFNNNNDIGGRIIPSSLDLKIDMPIDPATQRVQFSAGDIDGDGWIDLIAPEMESKQISIFRNLGVKGDITASSFAPKVSVPLTYAGKGANIIADFDGDGKSDLIVGTGDGFLCRYAVLRNTSVPGTIAFAPAEFILGESYADGQLQAADIDGDGRIELLATFDNSFGGAGRYFTIFQNLSQPGNIELAHFQDYDFGILQQSGKISVGDLDGDTKPDVVVVTAGEGQIAIFQNNSVPGNISLITPYIFSTVSVHNVVIADMDNDALPDLVWGIDGATNVAVLKNKHAGGPFTAASFAPVVTFGSTTFAGGGHVAVADMNSDSKPDIILGGTNDVAVFENNSTAGVLDATSFNTGILFEGSTTSFTNLLVADFDNDGKTDVATGAPSPTPQLHIYRNESFPVPRIDAINNATGTAVTTAAVGETLTVKGDYFNTYSDTPVIHVADVPVSANGLSNTSANVLMPVVTATGRVAVSLHGLTGLSANTISTTFGTSSILDATTFQTPAEFTLTTASDGLAVNDFDSDGKPDLALEDNGKIRIFRNTSAAGATIDNTTFTPMTATFTATSHLISDDADGDGKPDLVASNLLSRNNSGTQAEPISFEAPINSYLGGNRLAAGHDFNRDGKTDVAVSTNGNTWGVFENKTRKGPFTWTTLFTSFPQSIGAGAGGNVVGVAAADFDGDGADDVALGAFAGASTNNLAVLRNTANKGVITLAQFDAIKNFPALNSPFYIVVKDFDIDGKPDVAIGNANAAFISVFVNTSTPGNINFTRQDFPSLNKAVGIDASDLDGDGKAEIILINSVTSGTGSFSIFKNTSTPGALSFNTKLDYALANAPAGLAIADVNQDSRPDILITRNGAALSVFQNHLLPGKTITITVQPKNAAVCTEPIAKYSVTATGTTNLTYQWQGGDTSAGPFTNLSDDSNYSGTKTATLTVQAKPGVVAARYRVVVSGDFAPPVTSADATLVYLTCANLPPVISFPNESTSIGGRISVDLSKIITDPDSNLDLGTVTITSQPTSGATAVIDANHILTVDYAGLNFEGDDVMTLRVCDLSTACTEKEVHIQVSDKLIVYNGLSPNGDSRNDIFFLQNIESLPSTVNNQVTIFNRWGDKVFDVTNYNNSTNAFNGTSQSGGALPNGTYFYRIVFTSGVETLTGYLELRR